MAETFGNFVCPKCGKEIAFNFIYHDFSGWRCKEFEDDNRKMKKWAFSEAEEK